MDLEQRIGRIHRYGQESTAKVYNLVSADTIEGQIFLLLEEKLGEIAATLGKIDEQGQIAEDLRIQVLGQLSNSLSYDRLYQEALRDPTLIRTRQELEVALTNANQAREVVFELFQDLDQFNLGDYKKYDDQGRGMERLVEFVSKSANLSAWKFKKKDETVWELIREGMPIISFTTDRDRALQNENLQLLGLEHPIVNQMLSQITSLEANSRALIGKLSDISSCGLHSIRRINTQKRDGQAHYHIIRIGMTEEGDRAPWLERMDLNSMSIEEPRSTLVDEWQKNILSKKQRFLELLHRELIYTGFINDETSFSAELLVLFVVTN